MKCRHLFPSLAVLSLVGAAAVTTPAFAADAPTAVKATADKPSERADERIKQLHDQLKITPDQETKFGKLADVMRDNAKEMSDAVEKREAAKQTTSALDDLKAYQTVAQAHADGLKALVPAFEGLYNTLSDTQKAQADELFKHGPGGGKHGHKAS
jgi:Spy/CpxP family protein refolding chaperone